MASAGLGGGPATFFFPKRFICLLFLSVCLIGGGSGWVGGWVGWVGLCSASSGGMGEAAGGAAFCGGGRAPPQGHKGAGNGQKEEERSGRVELRWCICYGARTRRTPRPHISCSMDGGLVRPPQGLPPRTQQAPGRRAAAGAARRTAAAAACGVGGVVAAVVVVVDRGGKKEEEELTLADGRGALPFPPKPLHPPTHPPPAPSHHDDRQTEQPANATKRAAPPPFPSASCFLSQSSPASHPIPQKSEQWRAYSAS